MNMDDGKRENISTRNFMHWDMFKNAEPNDACSSIYEHITSLAISITGWYWKSIDTKRRTSLVVRAFSFLLLAVGTATQLYAATVVKVETRLDTTQTAVACLAIAALMTVADRAFGWSSGWLRYTQTVTSMENLIRTFQLEWAKFFVSKGKVDLESYDVMTLFLLAQELEKELLKLLGDETSKWVAEFNAGIAVLESAIKTHSDETERKANTQEEEMQAQEKAKNPGALEVTLVHTIDVKKVKIQFNNDTPVEFLGTSWAKNEIPPGQHLLHVYTIEEPLQTITKVVDIQAYSVAKLEVKLGQ